jgi:hypothetical protein
MNEERKTKIGCAAGRIIDEVRAAGLTVEDALTALGLAVKALAHLVARESDGNQKESEAHAMQLVEAAVQQDAPGVIIGRKDGGADADDNPLLATSRRRQTVKLH